MQLAHSLARLGTETAFEVLVRARALEAQGRNVIHLEIGEPDFATPAHIVAAAKQALDDGYTHYGPAQGLPELREAIAEYVSNTRGIPASPDNVCVVPGGKPIMFFSMLALLNPGDEVIYPNPSFPIYESMIRYCGATPVPMHLREDCGFSFDLDEFRSRLGPRTKLVILNSPANPTGGVMPAEDIAALAALLAGRDIAVLSDEIYSRMSYGRQFVSIASFPGMLEKTIILDGFSKTYAMTGWRLGYGVMPPALVDPVNRLMVNSNSCTASFTQRAGVAALRGPQEPAETMIAEFRRRRDIFVAGLNTIPGFRCPMPEGAFYAFPNIGATGWRSRDLANVLLDQAGVACLSGTAFGEFGEGYLRFSYANSLENLQQAVARIRAFFDGGARAPSMS
jgi:aspartate/methionine/tyrosine aminotransferase